MDHSTHPTATYGTVSQREGKGEPHTEGEPMFEQPNYFVLTTAMSWWPFPPPRTNCTFREFVGRAVMVVRSE